MRRRRRFVLILVGIAVVVGAYLVGVVPRMRQRDRVRTDTAELSTIYVSVVRPQRTAPVQELVLPGDVQAYSSTPIFARSSGYLQKWYVDIGATVKRGQILAVIEAPELEAQLEQAREVLSQAQANLKLAEVTAKRFLASWKTKSVSQQEVDTAVSSLKANQATVAADRASVRQLEQLTSYLTVRAPFDGLISERNVDIGDLINAGSSTVPNTALFQIVQPNRLRIYVSVPEAYASSAKPGVPAELIFASSPGQTFTGKLARVASAITPQTRTLQIEIRLDNPTGLLFAGAYAQVRLKLQTPGDVHLIPTETLIFRKEGLHVATVVNGKVKIIRIEPGRDFGDKIEVLRGLSGNDQVILNPADSITEGEDVRIAPAKKPGTLARPPAAPVRKSH
ncbi:MAG: efflux RND transporter periplasmic adaptor subunit [Kofleriaceae bacterium]|nr:efflux RND transporter periplasmic adaptor subunit [Kofleriaceae bacterium]